MKVIKSDKFKSSYLTINYIFKLKKEEVTENIIWATTIIKSTENYKKSIEIEREFAKLYATSYGVSVEKMGDLFSIQFRLEMLDKKYLPKNEDIFESAVKLMSDIIYNPHIINGGFDPEIINRQKDILKDRINAQKDDKKMYAINKCEELLCENPEDCYLYGRIEDLSKITAETAYKQYKKIIENSQVEIIINGEIENTMEDTVNKYIKSNGMSQVDLEIINNDNYEFNKYEEVEENMTQSILTEGIKIKNYKKEDVYKYIVFNSILGSGSTSKLFQNVREKASLAYYAFSKFNKFTGQIIVCTGIENGNSDKVIKIINEQFDMLKSGNITDSEYQTAINMIENNILEWKDSQYTIDAFYLSNKIFQNTEFTLEEYIENIKKVTKEDVIEVAKNMLPKVVFLIGGKDNA